MQYIFFLKRHPWGVPARKLLGRKETESNSPRDSSLPSRGVPGVRLGNAEKRTKKNRKKEPNMNATRSSARLSQRRGDQKIAQLANLVEITGDESVNVNAVQIPENTGDGGVIVNGVQIPQSLALEVQESLESKTAGCTYESAATGDAATGDAAAGNIPLTQPDLTQPYVEGEESDRLELTQVEENLPAVPVEPTAESADTTAESADTSSESAVTTSESADTKAVQSPRKKRETPLQRLNPNPKHVRAQRVKLPESPTVPVAAQPTASPLQRVKTHRKQSAPSAPQQKGKSEPKKKGKGKKSEERT